MIDPDRDHPPEFTPRALYRRIRVDTFLKAFGTAAGMALFFVGYFALMRHPIFPVTIMPTSWLDHALSFQPWSLLPYLSLWLYIGLLPAFLVDRRQLWSFALGCLGLSLAGYAVFFFQPTAIPSPDIDWSRHPSFQFLKTADLAANACPSLHAAFAVFTALWFERILPSLGAGRLARLLNLVWAALIVYSTLGTRQHVALDAYWGAALGAFAASLNFIATPCRAALSSTPTPLFGAVAVIKISALFLWSSGLAFGWSLALFLGGGALALWHVFAPNASGLVRVHSRFRTAEKTFWLTIDDGPDPADTPRILDVLDAHDAKATFFLVGERARKHPALVSEIQRRGHEIGHHTHTHPAAGLHAHSRPALAAELDDAIAPLTPPGGRPPTRFRAPVGIKNLRLARALATRGLVYIGWSIRSHDSFARDPEKVATRVVRRLEPGAIVLMHEGPFLQPAVRVEAIRLVLEGAKTRGYRAIVPAPETLV